jgi:alpha-glucosidase
VNAGALTYAIARDGTPVLTPSRLGFAFRGAPNLFDSLRVVDSSRASVDTTWTQPWGEVARVRDLHRQLRVVVEETSTTRRRFAGAVRRALLAGTDGR